MSAQEIRKILRALGDKGIAEHSQRFFKTGKGEYGEGDQFLGIRVPVLRKQVNIFRQIPIEEIIKLLKSAYHEERLFSLFLLMDKFRRGNTGERTLIYELYLDNTKYINNWDLVDSSAGPIVGVYLEDKDKLPLYNLSKSNNIWERRIAIISTFHLIRKYKFDDALKISYLLINDEEDLIHKAVGWMLREIGKRDLDIEKAFLKEHYKKMPRTMLRYAIEKFPEKDRKMYLHGVYILNK